MAIPLLQKRATTPNFDLFENDNVTPDQYFSRRRGGLAPEQRLMLAVLEDALHTYQRPANCWRSRAMRDEVRVWLEADDHSWPFSFVNCCQALELDPDAVRSKVRKGTVALPATSLVVVTHAPSAPSTRPHAF